MISVKRSLDAAALPLYAKATVKASDGVTKVTRYERERADAIAFFADKANYFNDKKLVETSFDFKVYKDKALAKVLSKDFREKCAYCESKFGAVTSGDIEHFRPKASILSGKDELKPGYYWLAGDWENLLISCPHCNRVRNHEVPGQSKEVLLGKGTQFPLTKGAKHVRNHVGDVATEADLRLLLHPCIDNPEHHLAFDEAGLVRAVVNGIESLRGKTSIDVYALQRKDLVEARRDKINELRSRVDDLQRLVRQHNRLTELCAAADEARTDSLNHIEKVLASIKDMMFPKTEYVAAKRNWLKGAHERGEFETLGTFGIKLELFLTLTD
jgi:uncharacterized protein (TIGR02646 family)